VSADLLLRRMADAYASARTYVDTGAVLKGASRVTFSTTFERPAWFRFEFRDDQGRPRRIVCRNEAMADLLRGKARTGVASLELAIATVTGVSGLSAHTVPRLLMPDRVRGWSVDRLGKAVHEGEDEVGNVRCRRLAGRSSSGQAMTVWIGVEDDLLRRVLLGSPDEAATTTYRPIKDGPVDRDLFRLSARR
jgi:hypothetical protein